MMTPDEQIKKLKEDLDHMTSLNTTNFNEVNLQIEKHIQLRKENESLIEKNRSLCTTISQLEKQLAQANEDWQQINQNSIVWQDKAEQLNAYTLQLEADYRESCATLRESVKALAIVVAKLK